MKWILLILGLGILRGVLFPDYRLDQNIILIPFGMPLLIAGVVSYFVYKNYLTWKVSIITGLVSVYLSTIVGIIVYSISAGWENINENTETQAIFLATIGIQTIIYAVSLGIFAFVIMRYNKALQPTAKRGG